MDFLGGAVDALPVSGHGCDNGAFECQFKGVLVWISWGVLGHWVAAFFKSWGGILFHYGKVTGMNLFP